MSTLFIRGYAGLAADTRGRLVQAGLEPAIEDQTVTFTTAAASTVRLLTFSAGTSNTLFVRLHADANFCFKVGTLSTFSATTSNARVVAGQTEFIGIDQPGLWVSAVGVA